MNARSLLVTTTVVLLASSARPTWAQDNGDATLMLAQPAVTTGLPDSRAPTLGRNEASPIRAIHTIHTRETARACRDEAIVSD